LRTDCGKDYGVAARQAKQWMSAAINVTL